MMMKSSAGRQGSKVSTRSSDDQGVLMRRVAAQKMKATPERAVDKKVELPPTPHGQEPAAQQISILPWSASLCCVLSVVSLAATLAAPWSPTPAKPSVPVVDLSWHARCAMMLIIQSMVLELFILVASYSAVRIATDDLKPKEGSELRVRSSKENKEMASRANLAQHNLGDSFIVIGEYLLKFFTAWHFMDAERVVSYAALLSPAPDRAVYPVRHLQWCLAVPLLVLISNRSFLSGHCTGSQVMWRSAPALVLTSVYCLASLAMEITSSVLARNLLMALVTIDFLAVSVDQVVVACQVPGATSRGVKLSMLGYQIFTFSAYTTLYFTAYFGLVGAVLEQSLYTYMDASVKVLHGCFLALLRNNEDIRVIRLWWQESIAARRDFERLVEQARVPIFGMDLAGRITSWNGSIAQITGLVAEAVEGEPVLKLLHHDCHQAFEQAQAAAAAGTCESGNAMELLFRKSFGTKGEGAPAAKQSCAVLAVSLVRQLSRKGAVEGYVGIGQDISQLCDLKAVEQKKTQLMAVVSHELRSPLHGMIGLTTAMETSVPDANAKRQLGMVRSCANRLLDLVTNIMDITESQQRERKGLGARDKKSIVNLLDVAEEVTVMTMMAVDKAGKPLVSEGVELRNLMPELKKFPAVLGNPYKLTQLFYNLMTNACKFTKKGSVTLRARHCQEASILELSVEDTGSGISKDSMERIFKPFEQDHGSNADSRSFQGMGLGLAVCKEAVRLHDGSISVTSEPEKGSTFTVSLPCQDTFVENRGMNVSKVLAEQRAKASAQTGTGGSGGPGGSAATQGAPCADSQKGSDQKMSQSVSAAMTRQLSPGNARPLVLSVDDDEVNQEVVRSALSQDYDIHSSMDGQQALDFLEECIQQGKPLPDVILLDIQMPGLTGYDVLAEVRQKYGREHSKLPVIMASAKTPVEHTAMKSYSVGCSDFLAKPFHTDVLKAKVTVALEIKREVKDPRRALATLDRAAKASAAAAQKEVLRLEATAKAAQEKLEGAERRADQAVVGEASAVQKAAIAEARARSEGDRAERAEAEVAELRKELQQMRAAAASSPTTASYTANTSPTTLTGLGATIEKVACTPPQYPPKTFDAATAKPAPFAGLGVKTGTTAVCEPSQYPLALPVPHVSPSAAPSLYQRLAECEQEIMALKGRLATEGSARALAVRQLDNVIWAAKHSRDLIDLPEQA